MNMPSQWLSSKLVHSWLRPRKPQAHKGDFGHVLVIAGSRGMAGAGVLAAWGALRGGAGLVTLAVPQSQQAAAARKLRPEAMTLGLPETRQGAFSLRAVPQALEFIQRRRVTTLAMGPGLTQKPGAPQFVRALLSKLKNVRLHAVVLDADGFLAVKNFKSLRLPILVTPHPGEFSKWTGVPTKNVQADRAGQAKKFAKLNGVICLLKGHETVTTDGREIFLNPTGNPGMAKGGSGDVLTGLTAALVENVKDGSLLHAAAAAVYVHGLAGDLAAREKTQIGMTAGDLAEKIPAAFKQILK